MTKQLSLFVALLALVLGTAACGGNPNKPELPKCEQEGALNKGEPLPCVFPPKPTFSETKLWVVSTDPGKDANLLLSELDGGTSGSPLPGGGVVTAKVGFEISEEHLNAAQGRQVSVRACLSVDGTKDVVASCGGYVVLTAGQNQGTGEFKNLRVIEVMNPGVRKTDFIRLHLLYTSPSASDVSVKVEPREWKFNWCKTIEEGVCK